MPGCSASAPTRKSTSCSVPFVNAFRRYAGPRYVAIASNQCGVSGTGGTSVTSRRSAAGSRGGVAGELLAVDPSYADESPEERSPWPYRLGFSTLRVARRPRRRSRSPVDGADRCVTTSSRLNDSSRSAGPRVTATSPASTVRSWMTSRFRPRPRPVHSRDRSVVSRTPTGAEATRTRASGPTPSLR